MGEDPSPLLDSVVYSRGAQVGRGWLRRCPSAPRLPWDRHLLAPSSCHPRGTALRGMGRGRALLLGNREETLLLFFILF